MALCALCRFAPAKHGDYAAVPWLWKRLLSSRVSIRRLLLDLSFRRCWRVIYRFLCSRILTLFNVTTTQERTTECRLMIDIYSARQSFCRGELREHLTNSLRVLHCRRPSRNAKWSSTSCDGIWTPCASCGKIHRATLRNLRNEILLISSPPPCSSVHCSFVFRQCNDCIAFLLFRSCCSLPSPAVPMIGLP
jgi:hypothetical protein